MPIYKVTTPTETRHVKAGTKAAAINHVIRPGVTAEPLSADQVSEAYEAGIKVETATAADAQAEKEEA